MSGWWIFGALGAFFALRAWARGKPGAYYARRALRRIAGRIR